MSNRIVVVTGSAGGIGSKLVDAFTALSDTVTGLDYVDGSTSPTRPAAARQSPRSSPGTAASTCCATTPVSAPRVTPSRQPQRTGSESSPSTCTARPT